MRFALVHDYLTQRGGAERVVLSMLKAFPDAPLHTSLYEPKLTYPAFASANVQPLPVNRHESLRTDHRRALPFLATAFSKLHLDHDVVLCSTSGWAHGVQTSGRKIVYCHSPARWLYQTQRYLGAEVSVRAVARRAAVHALRRPLMRWDRKASASADLFLANSTIVRDSIRDIYGRDAEIVPPPPAIDASGPQEPITGIAPGFFLCVSRLLPYKNVDAVIEAFDGSSARLVVVGTGPDADRLAKLASSAVQFTGSVSDDQLRWLYSRCRALVTASYEDYGLTPVEAASFGKPSIALRWGGFLDTVVEDDTGLFFDHPTAPSIRAAIDAFGKREWPARPMLELAEERSEERFIARLRQIVGIDSRVIRLPDVAASEPRVILVPEDAVGGRA